MGVNPQIVTEDTVFQWDGVSQRLMRGQVLDVPAGGPLERAIGPQNLRPVFRAGSTVLPPQEPAAPAAAAPAEPAAEPAAEPVKDEAPAPAPRKAAAKAADGTAKDDGTDGKDAP